MKTKEDIIVSAKMQRVYKKWIKGLKENGVNIVKYDCPLCKKEVERNAPEKGCDDQWSTMTICPWCEGVFFVKVTSTKVFCTYAK